MKPFPDARTRGHHDSAHHRPRGFQRTLVVEIRRAIITVQSVRWEELEPGYGYVRIAQFQEQTGAEFRKALDKLRERSGGLQGLVLDLRNNPGGLLPASIEVADALLDGGLIVYTEGGPNRPTAARKRPR